MEPTPENLQSLAALLEQAGMANREAEAQLTAHQTTAGYSTLLLRIVGEQSVAMSVRLMAAVVLKNYVKKFWSDAFEPVCDADKHTVKQQIVDLMLLAPPQIQKVLSTAVGTICQADFPTSWQDLLPNLVQKLASNDVHVMTGVLGTLHDIFKRYRHEFKSEDLWQEIKYVLDVFAEPFTALFQSLMGMIPLYENDKANLEIVTRMLLLVAKIFNSLNAQDLPEHFEDNMGIWLPGFLQLLRYDNVLLHTDDDVSADDAGALVSLKSQICSNIALYASMYDEESVEHLPAFVEAVWELLVNTPTTEKYDLLISHGIGFLTSVSERPTYRHLFEGGLTAICEKVIVPNMMLGESDQEMFEDDPEEWIRRDMEGSDVDTRRRAACDLVRALCRFFQKEVSDIFTNYISAMVGAYAADPAANYISKEAALYLITSLTVRATVRTAGATQINPLVDIVDFFTSHVLPELSAVNAQTNAVDPDAGFAILKGSCIKFIHTFRAQLPTEATRSALTPLLVSHLYASNTVVHTYAAVALEELCALPEPPENPTTTKLRAEEITPQLESILNAVFKVLFSQSTQANEFSGENEYLMKLVMRVIALSKTAISPYSDILIGSLTDKVLAVATNPSRPGFNHFLFESISGIVKYLCEANPEMINSFEAKLFPPFEIILQNDVAEFHPYVFQILSQMLEARAAPIPDQYMQVLPHLCAPPLWEQNGNQPALVRLLCAFMRVGGTSAITSAQQEEMLGVFRKLLGSRQSDHHAFVLVRGMIECLGQERMQPYMTSLFILIFTRLQSAKTVKLVHGVIVFVAEIILQWGLPILLPILDAVQPTIFCMVVQSLFVKEGPNLDSDEHRKMCAIALIKALCETPHLHQQPYNALAGPIIATVLRICENTRYSDDTTATPRTTLSSRNKTRTGAQGTSAFKQPQQENVASGENTGFQSVYAQLQFSSSTQSQTSQCSPAVRVVTDQVQDIRPYLVSSLSTLSSTGFDWKTSALEACPEPLATALSSYFSSAGVPLM